LLPPLCSTFTTIYLTQTTILGYVMLHLFCSYKSYSTPNVICHA
jgi:hypothetical protein